MKWVLIALKMGGLLLCCCLFITAQAQEIDPRAYNNTPVNINFLGLAYTQVNSPNYQLSSEVAALTHILDINGQSAKLTLALPYGQLSGSYSARGQSISSVTEGLIDPLLTLSVNLYGAPALSIADFKNYQQDLIIGASLATSIPWGSYDSSKLLNIGANRWFIRPGVGASQAFGPWQLELTGSVTYFSENKNFYGGNSLSQSPIYSGAGHVVYTFKTGAWMATDVNYYTGGQTSIDGRANNNYLQNWRIGATLALPINQKNSIRFAASQGVYAKVGNNFNILNVLWQYRWGPGI
ncbi:MAG: transporter [Burkholderiales bacterium]|jgi:hypothetical protein|nr:transporter [Burkholderiales bacterium]